MDFDLQWLLIGLPVAFALGWLGSRFDLRQYRRDSRDAPRAYFKGLNLLLNEQQDKAIDAFIEAVQNDPDTTDLHFALGNLFRRRGEFERAVRVHQHLLQRADLAATERHRAQHALAQDFLKAGLFDRAEEAFRALDGTAYQAEAQLALLMLYERSRDWARAIEVADRIEAAGGASLAPRVAHYWCELAQAADDRGDAEAADQALRRARQAAPGAIRPLVMSGRRLARRGQAVEALAAWDELRALARLQVDDAAAARQRLLDLLRLQPTLSAALDLLDDARAPLDAQALPALRQALAAAAKPLQRYRCAACGFEAQHWFWQCPGCLNWDSYPPRRIEEQ